jgi:hypothetical protein
MRHAAISLSLVMGVLAGASPARAIDPAALLQKCQQVQADRWTGVTHYVVVQSMMGQTVALPYERFEAPGPDGVLQPAFRPMKSDSQFSSAELRMAADQAERVGDGLSREMASSGLPTGMLGGGGDPWASTDPAVMMGGAGTFLRAAADAQQANQRERDAAVAEASAAAAAMADWARQLRHVGAEPIEGVPAQHLRAEGVGHRQSTADGGQMVIDTLDLWIDDRQCVPLKLAMTGTHTAGGKTQPVNIERVNSEYRAVAGSKMYEPHRQVMRIKGAITPDQQRELRESQAKLDDLERQLAQMPPGQRDMILQRMGPQMEMMKLMSAGGGIEVVAEVQQILINPDAGALRQAQVSAASSSLGGPMLPPSTSARAVPASTTPAAAAAPPVPAGQAANQDAYQACLEQKARERQAAQKKKQGMGRLLGAAGRIAGRIGGADLAQLIGDAQTAKATGDDVAAAARDLGLTEDEIAACSGANPGTDGSSGR